MSLSDYVLSTEAHPLPLLQKRFHCGGVEGGEVEEGHGNASGDGVDVAAADNVAADNVAAAPAANDAADVAGAPADGGKIDQVSSETNGAT